MAAARADVVESRADRVSPRGAGRHGRKREALYAEFLGDVGRRLVVDDFGDGEGQDVARAALDEPAHGLEEDLIAADAVADDDACALGVDFAFKPGVARGLRRGGDGILREERHLAGVPGVYPVLGLEVPDFSGDFGFDVGRVELGDGADAAPPLADGPPCGFNVVAKRVDGPQAGYDDSSLHRKTSHCLTRCSAGPRRRRCSRRGCCGRRPRAWCAFRVRGRARG